MDNLCATILRLIVITVIICRSPTVFSSVQRECTVPPLETFNKRATGSLLYRTFHGESPADKCLKTAEFPPSADLEHIFIDVLNTSDALGSHCPSPVPGVSGEHRDDPPCFCPNANIITSGLTRGFFDPWRVCTRLIPYWSLPLAA